MPGERYIDYHHHHHNRLFVCLWRRDNEKRMDHFCESKIKKKVIQFFVCSPILSLLIWQSFKQQQQQQQHREIAINNINTMKEEEKKYHHHYPISEMDNSFNVHCHQKKRKYSFFSLFDFRALTIYKNQEELKWMKCRNKFNFIMCGSSGFSPHHLSFCLFLFFRKKMKKR